jgi:FtsH-binding integral membrane protein
MIKESSTPQILVGVGLGLLLEAAALAIGFVLMEMVQKVRNPSDLTYLHFFTSLVIGYFFGVVQAITIVPSSLIFYFAGKHGVVRGLLYFGTFLALLNLLFLVSHYREFVSPVY